MKRISATLVLLAAAASAQAQSTSVTINVTDAGSQAWANGTYTALFVGDRNARWPGGNLARSFTGALNGSGSATQSLPDNNTINPSPSFWNISVCPNSAVTVTTGCFIKQFSITGSAQTANITPPAIVITVPTTPTQINPVVVYADAEISGGWVGFTYYNLTTQLERICQTVVVQSCTVWANVGAGAGGATSFGGLTSGTNVAAVMHVGTGATLDATGSGTITATNYIGQVVTINGTSITTIQQAIATLPASGGTIDARLMPAGSSLNLGTVDPGTKPTTILLGCFTYPFDKIIVQNGLHIIGIDEGTCTFLSWSSVTVGDSAIYQGPTVDSSYVLMDHFAILGQNISGQHAINIAPNGALNNSASEHDYKHLLFTGIGGTAIVIDASLGGNFGEGSIGQLVFDHVAAYETGASSVQIVGAVDNLITFSNCRFQETAAGTQTAILINSTAANSFPQNILFDQNVIAGFGQVAEIDGGLNVVFNNTILRGIGTSQNGFKTAVGTGTVHSTGIVINASDFEANNGGGAGGFLAKTTDASSSLIFSNNILENTPTAILSGFTNNVISFGNTGGGSTLGAAAPLFTVEGATSGSATIGAAAVAGTPNQINLPTATGTSGQFLKTDGGNPQQTSWGLLAQSGAIHSTGNTAAISTATLCAASAGACNVAGQYHIHFTFIETGTACATPGTGGVTFLLTWTDSNATTHSAISVGFDDASAINAVSQTFHFQTSLAAAWASGDFNVSTNGSVIQYATGYTACGVGTGQYQLDAAVTRLQ